MKHNLDLKGDIKSMIKESNELIKDRGQRIKALRKKKYISAVEIAEYMGISRSSFVRIENGERDMKCSEILEISTFLNVHPNKVMGLEAPRLVSDKIKRIALSNGFARAEINPRLYDFANTIVKDFHI